MLRIYVQPGASKSAWVGLFDGILKLSVKARPLEGEANAAVCAFIAEHFQVSRSSVTLQSGHQSRRKTVHIKGDAASLLKRAQILLEP